MRAASRARPSGATITSTAPRTTDTKNAYWCSTPRIRGFTSGSGVAVGGGVAGSVMSVDTKYPLAAIRRARSWRRVRLELRLAAGLAAMLFAQARAAPARDRARLL